MFETETGLVTGTSLGVAKGELSTLIFGGVFYFTFISTLGYGTLAFVYFCGLFDLFGVVLNDSSLKNIDFGALLLKLKLINLGELGN